MKNIILDFKNFFESWGAGSLMTSDQTGSEGNDTLGLSGHPPFLPSLDMIMNQGKDIPEIKKSHIVTNFVYNKNPIEIVLKDGTRIFLTKDQYDRMPGDKPIVPNLSTITVVFQRHPSDMSLNASKISNCSIKFNGPDYLRQQYKIKTTEPLYTAL